MKQTGFFDVEERLARLSGLGDQLEAFSRTVDFEVFRPDLEKALAYSDGSKGGRPPFDPVLMFKFLVIQTLNNLSDERTEYLINDRLSFMGFVAQILARDSRSESRLVTGSDEQAEAHALPNDELVHLQRGAEEAWITDGVV